jgi:dTDP-glucose 4,6-dehydratase
MRVLITGGAGFIAHHIIDLFLQKTDYEIVTLDRLDESGNLNRLHSVLSQYAPATRKRHKTVHHDLKAPISDLNLSLIGQVDVILHLAASSHVDRSITYPMEFVLDNTVGTVNLLDFARRESIQKNLKRFIYFSTDEIFGIAPPGVAYKERDRYNSTNPYSASKAAAEEFCVAYENTYKLPIFVTHTMNVFGERQHPEKFIPMCIRRARDGQKVFIHSDRTRTMAGSRFYIHARDVAEAMLFLLKLKGSKLQSIYEPDWGGARCPKFNIVGKEEVDNLTLATWIAEAQGKELNYEMVDFHTSRPGHDLRYALSGDYMRALGWEPKIPVRERINEVVKWSLDNPEWIPAL